MNMQTDAMKRARMLRRARSLAQWGFLALLVAAPLTGLFWIDPVEGNFVVLGHGIGFEDILIVFGFWGMVASLLVLTYSAGGQIFCGWACPQNTMSEWARALTKRLFGRKAETASETGEAMQLARRKRAPWRFVLFGLVMLAAAMLAAWIPLSYFMPPEASRAILLGEHHPRIPSSWGWIYGVLVVVMLINVGVIRHLFCKYMCIYRLWQHMFKTRETLHVAYDAARADECTTCRYCVDACFIDIDPRRTHEYDSCINCGACIAACDELHAKSKTKKGPGLLSFAFGPDPRLADDPARARASFWGRARVALPLAFIFGLIFAAGVAGYAPWRLVVDRTPGEGGRVYTVEVRHKLYAPGEVRLSLAGEGARYARLAPQVIRFAGAGRKTARLVLADDAPPGLHALQVIATDDRGWQDRYLLRYFVERHQGGGR